MGLVGTSELLQVYPSELLEKVWETMGVQWNDSFLMNTTLEFDEQNELAMVSGVKCIFH